MNFGTSFRKSGSLFCTPHLYFAAHLLASGELQFVKAELGADRKTVHFVFRDLERLAEKMEDEYESGKATVDPKRYQECLRSLRVEMTKNGAGHENAIARNAQ